MDERQLPPLLTQEPPRRLAQQFERTAVELFGSLKNIARRLLESVRLGHWQQASYDTTRAATIHTGGKSRLAWLFGIPGTPCADRHASNAHLPFDKADCCVSRPGRVESLWLMNESSQGG